MAHVQVAPRLSAAQAWLLAALFPVSCTSAEVAGVILDGGQIGACEDGVIAGNVELDGAEAVSTLGERIAEGCTAIEGYLEISDSDGALTSLDPLLGLTWVGGNLYIVDAPALRSLAGLRDLKWVGGLMLSDLPALTSLVGFFSLEHIDGGLSIFRLSNISSMTGLERLRSVRTSTAGGVLNPIIRIIGNSRLSSLAGLDDVTIEPQFFAAPAEIADNPLLPTCEAVSALQAMGIENSYVSGNMVDACG